MPTQDNRIGDTSAVILGLLHQEPLTGGQVFDLVEKWIMPYFSVTRSQVYRDLQTMSRLGLVREGTAGSRGSLTYRITPSGKKAFLVWYNESISLDTIRNGTALRLAFAGLASRNDQVSLVDTMKMEHKAAADRVLERIKEATEHNLTGDIDALRFALAYHEAALTWLGSIEV